jgi:alpha-N-arabinofuranosidase
MYKYHQDAQLVDSYIENKKIGLSDEFKVPNLHESVSMDDDGNLHITITNLSLDEACDIETFITEKTVSKVSGEIVTEKMNAYNTFEQPTNVKIEEFKDITVLDNTLRFTIPACSVMHITVK